jgi:demethylmenaquinone methyltransferase / 2-methoxy-6-polyprenyl-1,4-benzoquinol methylase
MRKADGTLKFSKIADRYDFLNHLLSFGLDFCWRRAMIKALSPKAGDVIMDLATGTGDSARPVVRKGILVIGIDISNEMLLGAKRKIPDSTYNVILGSAYDIPVKSGTFSGATCAFGIRNMHQTLNALKEIFRVMKKGGRVVFLEFSLPAGLIRRPYIFYLRKILPALAGLFSIREAYDYLGESIEKFHSPDEFSRLAKDAGFSRCEVKRLSMGCVYIYKAYKD